MSRCRSRSPARRSPRPPRTTQRGARRPLHAVRRRRRRRAERRADRSLQRAASPRRRPHRSTSRSRGRRREHRRAPPSETPDKAVNGSVSGGLTDKFCSKVTSTRYLRVDLGSSRSVDHVRRQARRRRRRVVLDEHPQLPDRNADRNERLVEHGGDRQRQHGERHHEHRRGAQARYIRLVITQSEQGTPPAPPGSTSSRSTTARARRYSAPAILYAGPNATGRAQRFQAGAYDVLRGNLGSDRQRPGASLDVAPGYKATVCRDLALTGCTVLAAGRHGTLPAGYDLAVSSLRVKPCSRPLPRLLVARRGQFAYAHWAVVTTARIPTTRLRSSNEAPSRIADPRTRSRQSLHEQVHARNRSTREGAAVAAAGTDQAPGSERGRVRQPSADLWRSLWRRAIRSRRPDAAEPWPGRRGSSCVFTSV